MSTRPTDNRTTDDESPSAAASTPSKAGEVPVRDAGRARAARDAAREARGVNGLGDRLGDGGVSAGGRSGRAYGAAPGSASRGMSGRRPVRQVRPGGLGSRERAVGRKVVNAYVTAVGAPGVRIAGEEGEAAPPPPPARDKIHSLLSALPVIMLIAGLWLYYSGERAQSGGAPILAESVEAEGLFRTLSVVKSGGQGRHYLWFDDGERERGARIRPEHRQALEALVPGEPVALDLAPTVSGSSTLWAWRVRRDGVTLIGADPPRSDR